MDSDLVVVTGIGVVAPNGTTRATFWKNLCAGTVAIDEVRLPGYEEWFTSPVAAVVPGYPDEIPFEGLDEGLPRSAQLAITAAREAVEQAAFDPAPAPHRVGVVLGTCQGSLAEMTREQVAARIPFDFLHLSCDAVAGSQGWCGPRAVVSNACAAGSNAIGLAADLLSAGAADAMLAGGTDSLTLISMSGFGSLQSLDAHACSPYGRSTGLSLGEGAAVLVLERLSQAQQRGAIPLACVLGYGLSADAYHITAPDPTGRGAVLAMTRALARAGIAPDEVDYVNGHGTGTHSNDHMEKKAFRSMFGERAARLPISSTKSVVGHSLGAAGAIEATACVLAIDDGIVPPTANLPTDPAPEFDFVAGVGRLADVAVAMTNNYAFGGSNVSLVLGSPGSVDQRPRARSRSRRTGDRDDAGPANEVVITGIGAIGAPGIGLQPWADALTSGRTAVAPIAGFDASGYRCKLAGEPPAIPQRGWADRGAWRRMDALSRQTLVASRLAWNESQLRPTNVERQDIGLFLGTGSGPYQTLVAFDASVRSGPGQADPGLFPNTAVNASGGHICTALGIRGPTSTIASGAISGLLSLAYAAELIRNAEMQTAVVVAGDEFCEPMLAGADRIEGFLTTGPLRPFDYSADGTVLGGGAAALIVESRATAMAGGRRVLARIAGWGLAGNAHELGQVPHDHAAMTAAMTAAIRESGIDAGQIGYCAAAAGGIRASDRAEARAIASVLGESVPVGAPKAVTGDCLATSGLVNVLAGVLAVGEGSLVPTVGLDHGITGIDHVTDPRNAPADTAIANAMAIGGTYASVVLQRADQAP